jgi:predicted aspartyl protease
VVKCAWNKQELPAPSAQAPKQPPIVAQDDKKVQTVPYRADLSLAEDSIPIYPDRGGASALVDVIVGGQPVRMLLDTGATVMQISNDLAQRIVRDRQGTWGNPIKITLADGSMVQQPTIDIGEVRIGSHSIRNVTAAYTDGGDMIMAFPVVNSIAPFKIDTRNRKLVFEKQEAS